jgi:hypothetical protein
MKTLSKIEKEFDKLFVKGQGGTYQSRFGYSDNPADTDIRLFLRQAFTELLGELKVEEVRPEQFCSGTCATQAPPEFADVYGCTCGSEKETKIYNEVIDQYESLKQQLLE